MSKKERHNAFDEMAYAFKVPASTGGKQGEKHKLETTR